MLKTFRTPVVAAMALFCCAGTASAVDLAANGGFETGDFTGWTQFVQGGTQTISAVDPSTGLFSANLNCSGGNACDTLIKQANVGVGLVNPGDEFTISFDLRGTTANGGVVFAEFFSELDGGGTSAAEILGGGPLFGTDDWVTYMFTAIAGPDVSGGVTLQLKSACGPVVGCMSDVFFDNVSITTASAVPVPAAIWLFGSALGLLGWAKRRSN